MTNKERYDKRKSEHRCCRCGTKLPEHSTTSKTQDVQNKGRRRKDGQARYEDNRKRGEG